MYEKITDKQLNNALSIALLQLLKDNKKINNPTYTKVLSKLKRKNKEVV